MRKLLLQIAAVLLLSVSFSACTEEEITPTDSKTQKSEGVTKDDKGF